MLPGALLLSLKIKVGVSGPSPRQLHVFDDLPRGNRGWVLSVAHLDVVPWTRLTIDEAVASLRSSYASTPDPADLLEHPFTLRQLQQLHETVAGESQMRDSFRRAMEPQLRPTGEVAVGTVGKPARMFVRI